MTFIDALVIGMVVAAVLALVHSFRTGGFLILFFLSTCLWGCTLRQLEQGVDVARATVGGYHLATHAARASIIKAHPECQQKATKTEAAACYELALVPFESSQLPVLACFPPLATLVEGAEVALAAKDVTVAKGLIPELAAKTAACGLAIAAAVPGGAK